MRQEKPRPIPLKRDGFSMLGGMDVGDYPKHKFKFDSGVEFERNWPLKAIVVGDDEWIAGCRRFRRRSRIFSLELVVEGAVSFVQNGRRSLIEPGEMLVIQPGQDYDMSTDGFSKKKVMILGGYLIPIMLATGGWSSVDFIKLSEPARIAGYFDRIYEACDAQAPGYVKYCSSQAYELLLELSPEIGTAKLPAELNRILCYMEENMTQGLSVASLCGNFSISPASLHRLFKRHLDCSPIEYLIRKRIETAKELLSSSNLSIKQISLNLGYANQFFFSTEFKKRAGCSPRNYRAGAGANSFAEPGSLDSFAST